MKLGKIIAASLVGTLAFATTGYAQHLPFHNDPKILQLAPEADDAARAFQFLLYSHFRHL